MFSLLASKRAVDFVLAQVCIFFTIGCLGRTTSERGTWQVMRSTVQDKRKLQHSHQACSRKVQGGNNRACRKALIALFKVQLKASNFPNFFLKFVAEEQQNILLAYFWYVRNRDMKLYGEADRNLLLRKPQRHPEKST